MQMPPDPHWQAQTCSHVSKCKLLFFLCKLCISFLA